MTHLQSPKFPVKVPVKALSRPITAQKWCTRRTSQSKCDTRFMKYMPHILILMCHFKRSKSDDICQFMSQILLAQFGHDNSHTQCHIITDVYEG